jgi:dihydroorotate dehydrogenase
MYNLLRRFLFLFPPEGVHYFSMNMLRFFCSLGFCKKILKVRCEQPATLGNIHLPNPVGLGAGFDKNAKWLRELETLGFGFVEVGTVTPLPQAGNPKPRLFRLSKDGALINRMGFNNEGAKSVAKRLQQFRFNNTNTRMIIGGNIGKNKDTSNEDAWHDYATCFETLHPFVDYFVVNVSSPNTPGLRALQEKESLGKILRHLQMINNGKAKAKPILLKIAPDLTKEQLDDVIDLALEIQLDGLVAANTTISRQGLQTAQEKLDAIGAGGLSGKPLQKRSTEMVRYICSRIGNSMPVIASGGIFTGEDAKEKLDAGAAVIQVWTGFIYEGPGIVKKICKKLAADQT